MIAALSPFRQLTYQTDLTSEQISQRLTENVITGFSLYSKKPYYGGFTPYSFSVRKTSSNIKKQGLGPSIDGTYKRSNGKLLVTLSLRPHTAWIVGLCLFGFPLVMFAVLGITEVLKTGEIAVLLNCLFPAIVLYGVFWLIFQIQSSSDIRFWEHTLQLEPVKDRNVMSDS
ncbi:hypothetical protein EXU85_30855 [Spirosoma sp. KCTC 42546]|uniref:hypothetical protein n=1 Tax=Spirosoma sp. KCTC 42546 TaxID=2520506 RepID=UPI001156E45C|nr:hypothetical protein [Spirosoma sp. KCTC 42546]QDK82772.1 hypothetical protein EXU85_30855 [Spirosoma sp. KCTC 42546]